MEFLAFLYTFLLVAICLMMALLLYRSAKPTAICQGSHRAHALFMDSNIGITGRIATADV